MGQLSREEIETRTGKRVIFARNVVLLDASPLGGYVNLYQLVGGGSESNPNQCFPLPALFRCHFVNQLDRRGAESEPVRQDEVLVEAAGAAGVQMVRGGAELRPEAQDVGLPVRRTRERS